MHKPFAHSLLALTAGLTIGAAPLYAAQDAPPPPPSESASPVDPAISATPAVPAAPGSPDSAATPAVPAVPAVPAEGERTVPTMPPPPPEALGKTYPVCSANVQDSCINRSEAPRQPARRPHHHRPG